MKVKRVNNEKKMCYYAKVNFDLSNNQKYQNTSNKNNISTLQPPLSPTLTSKILPLTSQIV
jgi:hypothetical protein